MAQSVTRMRTQDQNSNLPPPGRLGGEKAKPYRMSVFSKDSDAVHMCTGCGFAVLCIPVEERSAGFAEKETRAYRSAVFEVPYAVDPRMEVWKSVEAISPKRSCSLMLFPLGLFSCRGNWIGEAPYKTGKPCSACPSSYQGNCNSNMCFSGLKSNRLPWI